MEPQPPRIAAADALLDQRVVLAIERHLRDLHAVAGVETDENAGLCALVDEAGCFLPGAEEFDSRFGPKWLGQLECTFRQLDRIAGLSTFHGGGNRGGIKAVYVDDGCN